MNFRIWIPTLFFFLSICQNIFAAQVSGSIESDTIWEEEITVTGDVIIEISAKLTIRPGTVIRFNGDYSLTVNGLLIAEGVEGNLIQFISGNETPSAGEWSGVRLKGWQWEQNRLKHVEIRHAASGVVVSGTDVQARLSHVLVDQVSERGLSVLSGSSVVVENSTIRDFGDTGIRAHGGGSGLTLVGSTITQQNPNRIRTGRGVSVEDGAEVVLDGNQISFTDVGVYAHSNRRAPDVTALGNVITENRKGIQINAWSNGTRSYANVHVRENDIFDNREWNVEILAGSNPTNTLLDFTDNWWGTTDGVAIAGAIYDASNRDDRAEVNFNPFLSETSGIYGRADINRDGRTDGFDLAVLASSFGLSEEAEGFNGKADIYRDGRIDGFDLAILGIHFGQTGSDTTPQKVLPSQEMEPIEITVKDEYVEHSRADTVIYSVHLENVSSLFAIAVDLKYDKTLTFIEGEESNFINIEEQKSTVFLEDHDEKSNILSLGITRLNNASERFADGDGTVFRIKFLASESNSTLSDPILKRIGLFAPNGRQYKYNYNTDDDRSLTESLDIPENFELRQNYPNPFNPSTVIAYSLPVQSEVKLEVFDLIGRRVALLVDQVKQAGDHRVNFEAQNLSSGVYLYRISASGYTDLRKMSLIK